MSNHCEQNKRNKPSRLEYVNVSSSYNQDHGNQQHNDAKRKVPQRTLNRWIKNGFDINQLDHEHQNQFQQPSTSSSSTEGFTSRNYFESTSETPPPAVGLSQIATTKETLEVSHSTSSELSADEDSPEQPSHSSCERDFSVSSCDEDGFENQLGHTIGNSFNTNNSNYVDDIDESAPPPSNVSSNTEEQKKPQNFEYVVMLLAMQMKHHLTKNAVAEICEFVNLIKGEQFLPPSYFLFDSEFKSFKTNIEQHHLCKMCSKHNGVVADDYFICSSCGIETSTKVNFSEGNFFLYLPIRHQLKTTLENKDLLPVLNNKGAKTGTDCNIIKDIDDGKMYKLQMKQMISRTPSVKDSKTLCINFNTDGVPVFSSSKFIIWPVLCVINNLPPILRKKYVLLVSLWFGDRKPIMDEFLKPFVTELNELALNGFQYKTEFGIIETCYVLTNVAVCDSVARPLLQNMTQFNGKHGCSFCEHPGQVVPKGNGFTRVYPNSLDEIDARTHHKWLENSEEALLSSSRVKGIKGPSVLFSLIHFNMVTSFVPDYMHSILLGVVRQFFKLWFDSKYHKEPWYIGSKSSTVDEKLLRIQPPHMMSRTPRSITTNKFWKAHEWYNWLLFYSLVVLKGVLPKKYLFHWAFLVNSIFNLLKEKITKSEVYMSRGSLEYFTSETEKLYGKEQMTFNIHLCLHLCQGVLNWGPLWAHSGFVFENYNGKILDMIKSSYGVSQQIVSNYQKQQIISLHELIMPTNSAQYMFLKSITHRSPYKTHGYLKEVDDVILVGPACKRKLEDCHRLAIVSNTGWNVRAEHEVAFHYNRLITNHTTFYSSNYTKVTKRNNYTAVLKGSGEFFQIEDFIVFNEHCFALGFLLNKTNASLMSNLPQNVLLDHLSPIYCDQANSTARRPTAIRALELEKLAVFVKETTNQPGYVCLLPNPFESFM